MSHWQKEKGPVYENSEVSHGCTSSSLNIDKEQLLDEARTRQPDQHINWSQRGSRYALSMSNRGQVIKEYLAQQGISAAQRKQCIGRAQRRSKKRLPGGKVSFPMYHPVLKLKEKFG